MLQYCGPSLQSSILHQHSIPMDTQVSRHHGCPIKGSTYSFSHLLVRQGVFFITYVEVSKLYWSKDKGSLDFLLQSCLEFSWVE